MRKHSAVGVAAAAAVALAIPYAASADEMTGVKVSGFMTHDFGFGSYDGGAMGKMSDYGKTPDEFHIENDAEIHFTANGMTDGGLNVTAVVELEAGGSGGVDKSHITLTGGFGSVNIGQNSNAANMHGNKGIGGGYGGGGYYDCGETWTPASCGGPLGSDNDLGIRYSTPNVSGFQAGISYQVDNGSNAKTSTAGAENDENTVGIGANFSGDFAGTSIAVGAGWKSVDPGGDADRMKDFGLGTSVGIGSTTVSLRYDVKQDQAMNASSTHSTSMGVVASTQMGDIKSYGIGVDHSIGNLSFGIGYGVKTSEGVAPSGDVMRSNDSNGDGTGTPMATYSTSSADRTDTMISAGASYDLGGGVSVSAGVHAGDIENYTISKMGCFTDGPNGAMTNYETDGSCGASEASYDATEDLDDVGVGLRIAFSF